MLQRSSLWIGLFSCANYCKIYLNQWNVLTIERKTYGLRISVEPSCAIASRNCDREHVLGSLL